MIHRMLALSVVAAAVLATLSLPPAALADDDTIVLYCGRSKVLVDPLVRRFTEDTGIKVNVKYGKTTPMALALVEEGDRSPADVFWAQEAGTLGFLAQKGVFAPMPDSVLALLPPKYANRDGRWVGVSGRLRVIAYSPERVTTQELPQSVFDLTDPKYKNRVGWAPPNSSFKAFVTAMRKTYGEQKTRRWLLDMKANGAKPFPKNTAIVQGIANGEVDFGLPNHYYLLRFKAADRSYPVEQTHFGKGDLGNMNNLAGVGIVRTSKKQDAAARFVAYLLSPQAQQYFYGETFEIPVSRDVIVSGSKGFDLDAVRENLPEVDLDELSDLDATLDLLREVGLL